MSLTPFSEDEKLQLLFAEGVSSKTDVTEFSGRGVGLDAVRTEARRFGGDARIVSKLGEGLEITVWFKRQKLRSNDQLLTAA